MVLTNWVSRAGLSILVIIINHQFQLTITVVPNYPFHSITQLTLISPSGMSSVGKEHKNILDKCPLERTNLCSLSNQRKDGERGEERSTQRLPNQNKMSANMTKDFILTKSFLPVLSTNKNDLSLYI